jgi:hypothetical protein
MIETKKPKANYINNSDFLEALVLYKDKCKHAEENNLEHPPIPNYIGECFLKIAEHLSRKPNFASYTFREDMVSDGIENCLMYFHNFDPEKSKNPFSYFTQIVWYAFLRRIIKEKKQLYIKYKATEQIGILDEYEMLEDEDGHTRQFEMYDNISEFIYNYEESAKKKKIKRKRGVELFLEPDDDIVDT